MPDMLVHKRSKVGWLLPFLQRGWSYLDSRQVCGCILARLIWKLIALDLLASRLRPSEFDSFMRENGTAYPCPQRYIRMPLSFGFGENFEGMVGVEFIPQTDETRFSRWVGLDSQERAQPGSEVGLPLFPTYRSQGESTDLLIRWLKKTVIDEHSMNEWREQIFPKDSDLWMSDLLGKMWTYSYHCWSETGRASHAIDEILLHAWMMAIVTTMLSVQIVVPEQEKLVILRQLQFPQQQYERPEVNSSRPINKVVKYLLVTIYTQLVDKVMSALDVFVKDNRLLGERPWGHMYCVSILVLTVISQVQISLVEFHILAQQDNHGQWEETWEALERLEAAYRNVTLVFHWKYSQARNPHARNRARNPPVVSLGGSGIIHDEHLRVLLRGIQEIRQDYRDCMHCSSFPSW
jgi:hypothetical protein